MASNEEAKLRLSCKQSSLRSSPEPPRVTPTATNSSAADVIKADTSLLDNEVKRVRVGVRRRNSAAAKPSEENKKKQTREKRAPLSASCWLFWVSVTLSNQLMKQRRVQV